MGTQSMIELNRGYIDKEHKGKSHFVLHNAEAKTKSNPLSVNLYNFRK